MTDRIRQHAGLRKWGLGLTPEQRKTVTRLRKAGGGGSLRGGSDGWTVYIMPTTCFPPKYLELRHHQSGGHVSRWVIERDGTVSAHNEGGRLKELVDA